jgi:hypothetical protein
MIAHSLREQEDRKPSKKGSCPNPVRHAILGGAKFGEKGFLPVDRGRMSREAVGNSARRFLLCAA